MSSHASDPALPRLARGRFVVASRISRGSLSSTFRVQDQQARTWRALKLLNPELVTTEDARRFVEGGRWAATIDHPHVVAAYDSGEARKIPYLVLEYTGGGTVADWIARHGPMPPRAAALVAVQLADALTAVHGIGVVHNLVSPSALLVDPNGLVKLGELDLATAEGAKVAAAASSPFTAPDGGSADPRSDLYSVGMTLWALLRGEVPGAAPDPSVVADDSPHLEPIVRRCLAALPHRYTSVAALAEELLQALNDMPEDGDVALVVPAQETPVDRDTPDLAPAVDPLVDPLHPLHRGADADEEEDRPAWLPPAAPDEVIIGADVPVAEPAPEPEPERASVVMDDDPEPEPEPEAEAEAEPEPEPEPHQVQAEPEPPRIPPVSAPVSAAVSTAAQAPAPIPPRPEPVAPVAQSPVKRPEPKPVVVTSGPEPESEGGTPLWLKLLALPLLGGIGLATVLALVVTIYIGGGTLALSKAANQTALSQEQLYRVIDDERSMVERLGAKGADEALLEQAYLNYMEQRKEPFRLQAALEFAEIVDAQAARAGSGEVGPDQLALTNSLRKLRVARSHYEESLEAWQTMTETTRGKVVLSIGFGSAPDR